MCVRARVSESAGRLARFNSRAAPARGRNEYRRLRLIAAREQCVAPSHCHCHCQVSLVILCHISVSCVFCHLSSVTYMLERDHVCELLPAPEERHKHVLVTAVTNDATSQYNKKQYRSVLAASCFVHTFVRRYARRGGGENCFSCLAGLFRA